MIAALPPWPARREADNRTMFYWLNPKLDQLGMAKICEEEEVESEDDEWVVQLVKREPGHNEDNLTSEDDLTSAIQSAERGGIEPLREALIKLAKDDRVGRFINLPKQRKGVRWPREREIYDRDGFNFCETERIRWAADDVFRIRYLWRKHFKKGRRRAVDGWTAAHFASIRWEVTENQILNRLKKAKKRHG
jgi:hypothetical protein